MSDTTTGGNPLETSGGECNGGVGEPQDPSTIVGTKSAATTAVASNRITNRTASTRQPDFNAAGLGDFNRAS